VDWVPRERAVSKLGKGEARKDAITCDSSHLSYCISVFTARGIAI
jgi:hypothetical protein